MDLANRAGTAVLSGRGLSVMILAGSALLAVGPWLRSSISRDFRGIHIPWFSSASGWASPMYFAEVPRAWRLDSVAIPLLAVAIAGAVIVLLRPRWTSGVFALLLALSIPAVAATLWNHPALVEFFESEVRDRSVLRAVFRQHSEDMLASRAPDRLAVFGGNVTKAELLAETHPLLQPLRYWMYGPCIGVVALVTTIATGSGGWTRRLAVAGAWGLAGTFLAIALTWPRWIAEYHWARADAFERAGEFTDAERSLERARAAMPVFGDTRRYWLTKGRLEYRQRESNEFVAFFLAYQQFMSGDMSRARAEAECYASGTGGITVQRDLLAEILSHQAATYVSRGNHSAAASAWSEAAGIAPWRPAFAIGEIATVLTVSPDRAAELEQRLGPQLARVGDCFVGSDFASLFGDAQFTTGDFHRARDLYSESMELFHLPKYINVHAQEGRLGM